MPRITEIDVDNASQEVKNVIFEHLARGHRLTAEKRTLLHNVKAFLALEESSYALDDELQRLIGKRAADFYVDHQYEVLQQRRFCGGYEALIYGEKKWKKKENSVKCKR